MFAPSFRSLRARIDTLAIVGKLLTASHLAALGLGLPKPETHLHAPPVLTHNPCCTPHREAQTLCARDD